MRISIDPCLCRNYTIYSWKSPNFEKIYGGNREFNSPRVAAEIWKKNNALADEAYKPGTFTTFHAWLKLHTSE